MASTFFGLTIAYTGLQAAQTSINVTSHNLANINNQSYTKETASIKAGEALRSYAKYGTLGAGVIVDAINQTRDSYYDEKYRNNYTNYGQYNVKDTYMSQIQNYLNEFTLKGYSTEYENFFAALNQLDLTPVKGYSTEYENFFAALNQLDLTPADTSAKNQLINNAKSMTDYFNTLATNLRNVQIDANNEIKDTVNQINSLAQSISSLNKQINQIQANYGNANDLKDQRNALIDDLSKLVNISVSETDIGNNLTDLQITINGNSLVNGYNYHTLQTVSRDEPRNVSDAAGLYDIQWETGQPFNIYSTSLGGELKGLIDIRDGCNGEIEKYATTTDDDGNETYKTDAEGNILTDTVSKVDSNTNYKGVPYYQAQLNQFIQTFVSSINEILTKGVTSDGSASGIPLFVMSDGSKALTASSVTVNQDLIDNADLLATKYKESDGEANTSLIVDLINSKDAKIYDGGTGTYFLESIVSDMSIDASKAINFTKNYNNLKTTIQNQRLSVMGVDTDEEAMDLVKFQQAYNLSSKMMTVMNQLYDRLINNTGV